MAKQYVDIPQYTTFNDIASKDYSFSATQYKTFCINFSGNSATGFSTSRP